MDNRRSWKSWAETTDRVVQGILAEIQSRESGEGDGAQGDSGASHGDSIDIDENKHGDDVPSADRPRMEQ